MRYLEDKRSGRAEPWHDLVMISGYWLRMDQQAVLELAGPYLTRYNRI